MKRISPEIQALLKTVVESCDSEDRAVRERQLRTWRRLKLLWEGYSNVWWNEVAHDWRIWTIQQDDNSDGDQAAYDKPVNIFRAYLESIIAALSVTVPQIKCYPDDADNVLDLSTARGGDKIYELIFRHNNLQLLWLHALFIFCTEGMVAGYNYEKKDKKYGINQFKRYEDSIQPHEITSCPLCGFELSSTQMDTSDISQESSENSGGDDLLDQQANKFNPDDQDAPLDSLIAEGLGSDLCPACMQMMDPQIRHESFTVTKLVGVDEDPKSRVMIEAYGGLYVKIPTYARKQEECGYLIYAYETDYTLAIDKYEHLHGNKELIASLKASPGSPGGGGYSEYDQWARLSPQYAGEYPVNVVTCKHAWIRPSRFNILNDIKDVQKLKKLYPDGVCVTLINDQFATAYNSSLDDHWTITQNPLADYVHFDPLGLLLVSVQEITNDLLSLTVQTVEHGIGQTFADPTVLDFNAYQQTSVTPGGIFPAKSKTGKNVSEAFHEVKTAQLSSEVLPFTQQVQNLGQLVSGALPSLFGGSVEGSETASQYSMSRAQATQRLQNTWKIFTSWWKEIHGKSIPMYIQCMTNDEKDVQRTEDGGFINSFIRKAELEGKIGKVELEANENMPLTWAQQKDTIMQLLQASNPQLLQIVADPNNLPQIRKAIGIAEFNIPGEDDREKQLEEINQLLDSEPMPTMEVDPMTGEPVILPSVEIDPIFDNHTIQFEICKKWVTSEAGRQAKIDNPEGYQNVLLHGKLHFDEIVKAQASMTPPDAGAPNGEKSNPLEQKEAPITGEQDVKTVH